VSLKLKKNLEAAVPKK